MKTWDTDVLKTNLALMSSSHFYSILVFRADDVKTALFLTFLALVYALQNEVGRRRLVDTDHFHWESVGRTSNHSWKGILAYFTLEFGEIVRNNHTSHLFFDFTIYPHFQALHVYSFAWTFAFARRDEEVVRRVVVAKAKFTVASNCLNRFMHSIKLP